MVDKKGFLRVVEALIAAMVILSVLILISSQKEKAVRKDLTEIIPPILDEMAKNSSLREDIFSYNLTADRVVEENSRIRARINKFLKERINNPSLDFDFSICFAESLCGLEIFPTSYGGEIFSYERVMSSVLRQREYEPRKIKVFIWRKA